MSDSAVWGKAKGELRMLGQRHAAINVEALCRHLDALAGVKVAEVILNNHQVRLGREDASGIRKERPKATVREFTDALIEADSLSGLGITGLKLPESFPGPRIGNFKSSCDRNYRGRKGLHVFLLVRSVELSVGPRFGGKRCDLGHRPERLEVPNCSKADKPRCLLAVSPASHQS